MLRYTVLLHKNEEVPGYSVLVPELPGCFSQGRTVEDALANAKEAIQCHLEALVQEGQEVPVERVPYVVASVLVQLPTAVEKLRSEANEIRFVMHSKRYSLTRKEVSEGAERVRDVPEPDGKRLWYVRVEGKELPVRWLMQQLLGVEPYDAVLLKCIEVFRKLGFEVIYKGEGQPTWVGQESV